MQIALVIGSTISTIKDEAIRGRKLLIVRKADTAGNMTGDPFVAVDTVSAGTGDLVLITDGSSARFTSQTNNTPVDAVIVGVIDSLEVLLGSVFPATSPTGEISTRGAPPIEIDSGQLFTWLFVAGCIGVAVWSVINVFIAVMYNLISDIVGGIEVTLADRRER